MLQNARVTAFTISELFRKNQQGGKITLPPTKIMVRNNDAQPFQSVFFTVNKRWSFSMKISLVKARKSLKHEFLHIFIKRTFKEKNHFLRGVTISVLKNVSPYARSSHSKCFASIATVNPSHQSNYRRVSFTCAL